jgi:protein translocase SecG subunit
MKETLYLCQIFVSAFLIILILLQKRGSAFGGSEFYPLRRGLEKTIFYLTIFFASLFIVLALLNLFLK